MKKKIQSNFELVILAISDVNIWNDQPNNIVYAPNNIVYAPNNIVYALALAMFKRRPIDYVFIPIEDKPLIHGFISWLFFVSFLWFNQIIPLYFDTA